MEKHGPWFEENCINIEDSNVSVEPLVSKARMASQLSVTLTIKNWEL